MLTEKTFLPPPGTNTSPYVSQSVHYKSLPFSTYLRVTHVYTCTCESSTGTIQRVTFLFTFNYTMCNLFNLLCTWTKCVELRWKDAPDALLEVLSQRLDRVIFNSYLWYGHRTKQSFTLIRIQFHCSFVIHKTKHVPTWRLLAEVMVHPHEHDTQYYWNDWRDVRNWRN